jgi:pimeloyl-ACP methyl ester carboxylesterase
VPKPIPKKPGTLIKSEKVDAPDVHGTVYRVMYSSTSQEGKPRAITGVIVVPDTEAPKGGYPVVTWAHGTNGMADECAASLKASKDAKLANNFLDKGWLFTATDQEGEGTPGLHPYIAGEPAAYNTIDIVRAARQLRRAHASTDYVVWGHSQGGHTAMFSLKVAEQYAPELDLHGVVAGAPPSQFDLLYSVLKDSPFRHYIAMAAGGLNAAYGDDDAPLDEVLTPEGIELLDALEETCNLQDRFANVTLDDFVVADPFTVPKWKKILEANDPTRFTDPVDTPLLIIHGGADEQIPTVASQLMTRDLCPVGFHIERWVYPGQSHAGVIGPSMSDMIAWMDARFAGRDPGGVTPTGLPNVDVTSCDTATTGG